MRKTLIAGFAVGIIAALGLAVPANAGTHDDDSAAELWALHAIPDTPVDVYVDGELVLDDFEPGDLAGPFELPAGDYEVALTAADATDASEPILGPQTLSLDEGANATAVAHLTEEADAALTLYANDTAATAEDEGRLTVRHVAAAPAVDVLADDVAVIEDLANPDEATLDLAVGTVSATVALAGTTEPVLGPTDLEIENGVLTIVYAWGSAEDDTLALATQTIPVDGSDSGDCPDRDGGGWHHDGGHDRGGSHHRSPHHGW